MRRKLRALKGEGLKLPPESGDVLKPKEVYVVFTGDPTFPHETFLRRPQAVGHAAILVQNHFTEVMVGRYVLETLDPLR